MASCARSNRARIRASSATAKIATAEAQGASATRRFDPDRRRRETPNCPRRRAGENARPTNRFALRNMTPDTLPESPPLSLQNKLDRIAHERDVLALLHELARAGLREGDAVRLAGSGTIGRLWIDREGRPPRIVVVIDGGTQEAYSAERWLPV
jgi:hypothetical protein